METYPDTLVAPDYGAYSGSISLGLVRSDLDSSLANQRTKFNTETTMLSMTFKMSNTAYVDWINWVNTYAYDWFLMPVVSAHAPVVITSTHQIRFRSNIKYDKQGHQWLSVSVQAEIKPADGEDENSIPANTLDFISAETPATAPTDVIIAGGPFTPSSDWVRSELYYNL